MEAVRGEQLNVEVVSAPREAWGQGEQKEGQVEEEPAVDIDVAEEPR